MPEQSPGKLLQSLSSRFELRGRLGSGSMGVVYRAFDRELGREVALKTLRAEDPNLFYSLKEEFRAAASIVHPNLVELYELFVHGAECFFTMELLDAVPFTRSVRHGSSVSSLFEGPTVWAGTRDTRLEGAAAEGVTSAGAAARLAAGAAQLVAAVAALHDAGRVHCDLKPSNILVTSAGRLVVLDFGLSAPLLGQLARSGFSGTLSYAAPEQLWGGELTEATDWYSVGVVLYEAFTGELPAGEGQLREGLAVAWGALEAESVSLLPERLVELVRRLLHLDPAQRPTRHEIVSALVRSRPRWSTPPPHERQFVGRRRELGMLQQALLSTRDGWVSVVAVHGESGMGKTELLREFALQAARDDALLVRGQCRLDESVAYQALDQVIDELSKHLSLLPWAERQVLLPEDFASLVRVFPVLGRLGRPAAMLDEVDPTVLRQRAVVALRQLLWRLCAWRPLVVWIDDAHWGDAESQSLICDLLQPPAPPLLLLLSHREGAGSWLGPIAQALQESQGQWLDITLNPLDSRASTELVGTLLGPLAREQPLLANRVAVESGRVPLFIGQLCRLIAETSRPEDAGAARLTLVEVIDRRVSALALDEQRVAELVALIEAPLPPAVVAEAAGLPADQGEVVSRLVAAQLLRLTGARAAPKLTSFHQRVRERILLKLDPASRRRYHGRLATALERLEPRVDAEILLHHWLGADERERALEAALRAARAATGKLAFSHAAGLYGTALGLLEASTARYRQVQEKLADTLSAAGRAVEAGEQYLALAASTSAPDSLRWSQRAAENFLVGGLLDKGMEVLGNALRLVRLPEPPSTARAVATGLARVVLYRLSPGRRPRRQDAHEALRADLCLSAAKGLGVVDPMLSAYFAFSSLASAARSGDASRRASALCLSGSILAFFRGRLGRWGEEWLAEAEQIADGSEDGLLRGRVSVCQAQVELNRGKWNAALVRCNAATRWLELHPDAATWERNMADVIAIRALEELGELKQAWKRAAAWRSDAQSRGDLYAETTANLYLAFAKLADDDADQAEQVATSALSKWAAAPPFHEFYRLRVVAYAQLYRGQPEAALATLAAAEQTLRAARFDSFPTAILEVSLLRARIHLRLARVRRAAARALASCERDLDRLERIGREDASGHASLLRAAVAATRGRRPAALELLGTARARFSSRQMALGLTYVAAAEDALGGGRPGTRPLAAEASLRRQGIIQPQAWLALHAPGFA